MDTLREYLSSNFFSKFGYFVAVSQLPAFCLVLGYTAQVRSVESRRFRCPSASSPYYHAFCFEKYDEQFNYFFPLYAFVLLSFFPQLVVCTIYSQCLKSRVDKLLEAALKADPENPRRRPRITTRRVFYSYFLHLLVRLLLGILFVVLQNFAFYPNGFPTDFICVVSTVNPTVNSTNFNATKDDASAIDCDNPVGSDKATVARGIWILNLLFALLVFGELCYISVRGIQSKEFTFDSEFCQRHFFNIRRGGETDTLHETTLRMKRQIRESTEILEPLIAQPEIENKRLDDIFVNLVIYTGRTKHKFTDVLRRHEIFDVYLKPQHGSVVILKKLEELFLPNKDTQDPRKILVVGSPGVGKSLLCTKLSRDWSGGDLCNKDFEYLFLFQFRWFNTARTVNISLKHLLSLLCPEENIDSEVFQDILDNPEKVLLIFDGLDEFRHCGSSLEEEQVLSGNSPTEEMPFSALYVKLVKGKQLSGATVLTTCRPYVLQSVRDLSFDRVVEIMGFTPALVQEYVHQFCSHDMKTVNKIFGLISKNLELLSLCQVPMFTFIVCSFLKVLFTLQDQDSGSSLPATLTEICHGALRLFIFRCHPEFKGRTLTVGYLMGRVGFSCAVEQTLSLAGLLAKGGIEEGRLVFGSREVRGMENCGLFNQLPDRDIGPFEHDTQFCFLHLTLQQLLAAREIARMEPSDLSAFITSNASDPKWHLVIQFVAGLLHGQENEAAVNSFVRLLCNSLTEEPPLMCETNQKALLMMKCLHEYNDETPVKKAASELQRNCKFSNRIDLSDCQVTPADLTAVVYFIKHLHELTELDLSGNSITDQGVAHLCDALKDVNCKLTELDLSGNSITDQGVAHLCDALKDVNCKLTELNLSGNIITDQGVAHLCDALKDVNCKLTDLDLSGNSITDQGVAHLCDALKDVNCKLTELDLSYNSYITDKGKKQQLEALAKAKPFLVQLTTSRALSYTVS
ncbi:NACHT, LRR and PYD domains-containing protein 3-like [Oculina patagonica]